MKVSPRNEATALLTLHLGQADTSAAKPLSPREWTQLARWLAERRHTPEDLLGITASEILADWDDPKIPAERVLALLDRGYALSLKLTEWLDGNGLRMIGRSDAEYPRRLRQRLGESSPPLLFASGQTELLRNRGLAVVGSRHATDEDIALARAYGVDASEQGLNVVSGGAKGIDSAATDGALDAGGTAIAVLGDSLLQTTRIPVTRSHIHHGSLLLITPFTPDAPFSVGNAMARNKLIYCLSDAAVVVASESGKGGTFTGAVEALKAKWVPVGILPSGNSGSGFALLKDRGGIELSLRPVADLRLLLTTPIEPAARPEDDHPAQASLFAKTESTQLSTILAKAEESPSVPATDAEMSVPFPWMDSLPGLMEEFVRYWAHLGLEKTTADILAERLGLQRSQVQAWLKVLVDTERVDRSKSPVRYTLRA